MAEDWGFEHVFHFTVNATNFERSIDFYTTLGFEVLRDNRDIVWPDYVATQFGMSRAQGKGALGSLNWAPTPVVSDALDQAFDRSFGFVVPTGKRILVAVDVSGSMHGSACAGSKVLNCLEAGAAMAMSFVRIS